MAQLQMLRMSKEPERDMLPQGYTYATHKPEYLEGWLTLSAILGAKWSTGDFEKKMLGMPGIYPEGIFYILNASHEVIATATGIANDNGIGTVHMVAMGEGSRGLGLGRPLCAKVVNYLLARGMKQISLKTDEFRIPAMKIYLKLAFIPVLSDETMLARWQGVGTSLERTILPAIQGDTYLKNIMTL